MEIIDNKQTEQNQSVHKLPEWYETVPEQNNTITISYSEPLKDTDSDVKIYDDIEKFINNRYEKEKEKLSPYTLHAQISGYYYYRARDSIVEFFKNDNRLVSYGSSSSHMRSHNLYRSDNGIIYVVHLWCGEICDAFYFSRSELETYFEGEYMDSMPDYDEPSQVNELA
tara:strand:- start:20664 stop:21170 length:507 start_codon:yes stop_codon:yes gene_type:complete